MYLGTAVLVPCFLADPKMNRRVSKTKKMEIKIVTKGVDKENWPSSFIPKIQGENPLFIVNSADSSVYKHWRN
jgi:hypothetical protein